MCIGVCIGIQRPVRGLIAAVLVTALSACGSNNPNPTGGPFGQLRVANAIADANPIDATVVSLPVGNFNNISFGFGSGFADIPLGSYRVQLTTDTSAGQLTIISDHTQIDRDHETTVYAVGRLAQSTQAAFVVEQQENSIAADKVELQFVHAASHVGAIDIYVTAPGATLVGATPVASLSFPSNNAAAMFNQGMYRIRATPQGNAGTVLFDSGTTGVNFAGGTGFQIAALDNTDASVNSTIILLVLDSLGGNRRIVHAGP